MTKRIVVVGAGGFGREALDVIEAINAASIEPVWRVEGVLDDNPAANQLERLADRNYDYLGKTDATIQGTQTIFFTIGIGSPTVRATMAAMLLRNGWTPVTLVHPSAVIGSMSELAEGTIVCAGVQLSTNIDLGRYVHLNPGAVVGHDTVLKDFVSVNPGAIISGEVEIQERALVGAGAIILQGLVVGQDSIVGAGACVTKNVKSGLVVKGVPAR